MTRKLLIAFALFLPQLANAQAWTVSEVTPTWDNVNTWTPPIAIDSAHPADAYEPAVAAGDNVLYTRESWVFSEDNRSAPGTAPEAKFRTNCKPSFIKRADPILYRGQHPAGHGHTFFGLNDPFIIANIEDFDYAMGRAHPSSACAGGPLNATAYWEPSIYDDRYGLRLTVLPTVATFYYTITATQHEGLTHLRRDIRFIGGANPADYNDTARRAEYTAAGLEYPGQLIAGGSNRAPSGFLGIRCYLNSTGGTSGSAVSVLTAHSLGNGAARYLKGPNGEDPWNGGCDEAGAIIVAVNAPDCWDGTNLSSPDGRDHFRYSTRDEDNVPGPGQCPMNYVKVPHFETKVQIDHNGWTADLQHWYMASDRMRMATAECPDPASPCDGTGLNNVVVSNSPCRSTGLDFCPFETAHFDWWGAWDNVTIEQWQVNCVGITIDTVANDHADCGFSGLAENRTLLYSGAPPEAGLSSDPVSSLPDERASDSTEGQRYFPVRPEDENQDAVTIEVHPHS